METPMNEFKNNNIVKTFGWGFDSFDTLQLNENDTNTNYDVDLEWRCLTSTKRQKDLTACANDGQLNPLASQLTNKRED